MSKKWVTVIMFCSLLWQSSTMADTHAVSGSSANTPVAAPAKGGAGNSDKMNAVPAAKPGIYVVRAVWKNAPLSGVRVEWRQHINDASPALVGDTVRIGTAIFRPKSGTYYVTAQWRHDDDYTRPLKPGDRFAWYGGNPFTVSSDISETVTLMLEEIPTAPLAPPEGTGIYGRVTLEGAPVGDAIVFAYAKTDSGMKADDYAAAAHTNTQGEFTLELPAGRYFLLARQRADRSAGVGPMHKGDLLGYNPLNPVVVEKGRYSTAAIPMARLRMDKSRAESSAFQPGMIVGRIVDRDGQPVAGAYAALYQNAKLVGRPVFMSGLSGSDGRFRFSVPVPGNFFLGARSGYGTPVAGAWFGVWNGKADHAISIKSGEVIDGVEIVVERLTENIVP